MTIVWILVAIVVAAALLFVGYGRENTWSLLTGPSDPGRYDFTAAPRRPTGNDALACSPGMCAKPDWALPSYAAPPESLITALAARLQSVDPLARRVDEGGDADYARFVTFSPLMRFPDAIDMRAARLADGRTGIALYARAKLGSKDFGKNRARIQRLMTRFEP